MLLFFDFTASIIRFQELNVEERAIGNDVGDDVLRCDFPHCRLGTIVR
jgi:hypothetical protein